MAGGDDDVTISGSFSGSLSRDLQEIVARLERVESKLDEAGRAGERAGDKIERGARDAEEALHRVSQAGEEATEDLFGTAKAADKAGDELSDVGKAGDKAAAGLEAAEQGAEGAAEALDDTARQAKQTARALDDAGDEAVQAGAKAAASSAGWGKLTAALQRNQTMAQRWGHVQDAMRWSAWTQRTDKFKTSMRGLLDLDYNKGAKGLSKLGKAFGGFKAILMVGKITAVVGALYALLGVISALGAGAAGAVGGVGSLMAGLLAFLPVAAAGVAVMLAFKAAAKPLKDELDAIKGKFAGVGNAIANEGGMRKALDYLDKRVGKLAENVTSGMAIIGRAMSKSTRDVADYVANYDFLKRLGTVWVGLGGIVEKFGKILTLVLNIVVNLIRAALPAAQRFTSDVVTALTKLDAWLGRVTDSGKAAAYISGAYDRLRRTVLILSNFIVGLYRVFKIAAQESRWMADGLEAASVKFKAWTGSAEGENKIRKYFQDSQPALKETLLLLRDLTVGLFKLGTSQDMAPLINQIRTQLLPALFALAAKFNTDLLPKLIEFVTKVATLFTGLDFSALSLVVDLLIKLADACLWISQNVPGGNAALSVLFTTLLLAGPVAKVLGWLTGGIGKLVAAGKWLATALAGGSGLSFMQKIVFQVGRGVMWLLRLLTGPLIKGIMLVGRVLAVAFLGSNPVGWIILAIIAVVAALWWCYENIEGFRNFVDGALRAIGGFFTWLWESWIKPVLEAISTGFKWLGAILFTILVAPFLIAWNLIAWAVQAFLDECWTPFVDTLKEEWQEWYDQVFKPVGDAIAFVWNWLGTKLAEFGAWFMEKMDLIGQKWDAFYAVFIAPIANWIGEKWAWLGLQIEWLKWVFWGAVDALGQKWNEFYARWIEPITNWIAEKWDWLGQKLEIVKGWFRSAVDLIGQVWDTLKGKLAKPVNFLINTVWNQGILKAWNWVAEKLGLPVGKEIAPIPEYASGGPIRGPGTGRSDSILAAVSNNEHVWTAEETRRAGGHARVERLRRFALRAGPRGLDSLMRFGGDRFADGGPVLAGQGWARGQVGKPYTWGSAGPNGYDCSGAMSALTNVVTGSLPWYRRLFSTASFFPNRGAGGFVPGLGSAFAIGVSRNTGGGVGHMAGTLGGLNIESSSGAGFHVGPSARGADNSMFPMQFSLPQVGGQFVSGGGGFLASLWSIGKPILDAILNPLINAIPFHGPPQFLDVPKALATKAKDEFYKWAEAKLGVVGGVSGGAGDPAVRAAVQAVAAGFGWGSGAEWAALDQLIQGESGWNMFARNPTSSAAGLFQKMTSLHGPIEGDAAGQAQWGLNYIRNAYGSPTAALAKWLSRSPHWYDDGGMLQPGLSLVANGTGKPEPVFSGSQWDMLDPANLVEAMHATPPSLEARAASAREDELIGAVRSLSTVLAERPPALAVSGDETRRAVLDALDQRDREQRVRNRYKY